MKTTINIKQELQHKINAKTKPLGALGMLEDVALQIGCIQQTLHPKISSPHIVVFAGDHGIAATGLVNPYPQAVTAQMVLNFLNGGAAINVFCRQNNIKLKVVDAGVNHEWDSEVNHDDFINAKINFGTRNYQHEPAMSETEISHAMEKGKDIVAAVHEQGCNTIGFGEMGIGNTSSASLIMSVALNLPLEECIGRGTGANDEQLAIKIKTLRNVHDKYIHFIRHNFSATTILQCFGGYEIAMMVGAYLEAAQRKMVIVVDGFIATSALLLAHMMNENVLGSCVFAHASGEQGHTKILEALNVRPLLQLGLRLGEGTGAALAIPLLQSAVAFVNEMASFESAGVSNKSD